MTKIISFFMSIVTLLGLMAPSFRYALRPTVEVDCAVTQGEISSRASGFLYGLAEEDVPSKEMVESIDIASVSQKTIDGLQHPIGDIDHVAANLKKADHIVVYLQDAFDTWYYAHGEINDMRAAGTYDWQQFIEEKFFPKVEDQIIKLRDKDYADKLVYCLYNECDNAVWFGVPDENGWLQFNEEGRKNFYSAWKQTYELVKSLDPDGKIGGPGYFEYNPEKLEDFLAFCKENDCVPDVMIYHELQERSSEYWVEHVEEYRTIEAKYGIEPLEIIVTEYGTMEECGNPGAMFRYVCAIENSGTYGNVAYWRLANNLCDTAADDNSPNANWWLYRWYADMEGAKLQTRIADVMHADVANVVKYRRDRFHFIPLNGIASVTEDKNEVTVLMGGCDYTSYAYIKNLNKTNLANGYVNVKVETVYYKGLSGVVSTPYVVSEYTTYAAGSLNIKVPCADKSSVYRVTVSKADGKNSTKVVNNDLPVRYEFENGTLLGNAYTYDSAYATTGQVFGMVGGMENTGDGVSIKINAPADGKYALDVVYGKHNDAGTPDGRVSGKALCYIDGECSEVVLPNTVRSEFTTFVTLTAELSKGEHTLEFRHLDGTFVLDSVLVSKYSDVTDAAVLKDSDRTTDTVNAFLCVAPFDGYFDIAVTANAKFTVDGIGCTADENGCATVYLRRGLNYIEVCDKSCKNCTVTVGSGEILMFNASEMTLSDGAEYNGTYITGISSESGKAEFTVNAPESGNYRLTFTYSNNREGGVHSYNVDLIECYVTVTANGESKNLWCRNTQSDENFRTATVSIDLEAGDNVITLTNNGNVKFNNMTSYAPNIVSVAVAKTEK